MSKLQSAAKSIKLELVAHSTVWNYHNAGSFAELASNERTNLHAALKDLHKKGHAIVTLVTGCIGWSQHSATKIGIFAGETDSSYTTLNLNEIFA